MRTKVKEITINDELSREISLEYYVVENGDFFGIEIEKYFIEGGGKTFAESENGGYISRNQAAVTEFAAALANNSVTPLTLLYVIDDAADMWYNEP